MPPTCTMMRNKPLPKYKGGMSPQDITSSVVVLMDEDRRKVENEALRLQKVIFNLGLAARIETLNTMEALGSLPGHGFENIRRPILTTQSLADLLPSSTIWTGPARIHARCTHRTPPLCHLRDQRLQPCLPAQSSCPRRRAHHDVRSDRRGQVHGFLALLAMQMRRYENASIFVFRQRHVDVCHNESP